MTDPATLLAQLTTPIPVVIGKQDIQVDCQADGAVIEALVIERQNITIVYPEHANHVLKYESRPRAQLTASDVVATYNAEARFSPPTPSWPSPGGWRTSANARRRCAARLCAFAPPCYTVAH